MCDTFNNANDLTGKNVCDVPMNGNIFLGVTVWDVYMNGNVILGLTVWDVHTNGNVFLRLAVWNVHTNGNISRGLTVWDVVTTENDFACIIVFFEHYCTYNRIWSLSGRTRPHFAERVCQEVRSPTVSGSCGKDPPITHTHLATVPNAIAERG